MIKKKRNEETNGFELWGGYMEAKKTKLLQQYMEDVTEFGLSKSDIFKGIAIFVNGYTDPTADELRRIMLDHGGIYHQYESHKTTHTIASNLPHCKEKKAKGKRIVRPAWIVDSVKAGKILDFRNYLLCSNESSSQPSLSTIFKKQKNYVDCNDPYSQKSLSGDDDDRPVLLCSKSTACTGIDSSSENTSLESGSKLLDENECLIDSQNVEAKVCDNNYNLKNSVPPKHTRTASDANFLAEFYSNSRLHHISTMGAMFKNYIRKLRNDNKSNFPGCSELKFWKSQKCAVNPPILDDLESVDYECGNQMNGNNKTIMHIDMDCFFVSVGLRNHPELVNFPVAVAHAKGNNTNLHIRGRDRQAEFNAYKVQQEKRWRIQNDSCSSKETADDSASIKESWFANVGEYDSLSEIASCNYKAREAGLKNGMFLGHALKLCPNLKIIPYDFEGYKEVAMKLYETLTRYTLNIEAVSCDEMYVDCTSLLKEANITPLEFASYIRKEINEKTSCAASTGFGSNQLQARLATRRAKPDGQFYLEPHDVLEFMDNIKIEDLPGVGNTLSHRLHSTGVRTCHDLKKLSLLHLKQEFGNKIGETLYNHCRGVDNRELDFDHQRKSVSAEVNYGIRFTTINEAEVFLKQLSREVEMRLQECGMRGRCVTLKLMIRAKDAPVETAKFMGHGVCDYVTKSSSLPVPIFDYDKICREVLSLYHLLKVPPTDLRGIGIQITRLEDMKDKNSSLTKYLLPKCDKDKKQQNFSSGNGSKMNSTEECGIYDIKPNSAASSDMPMTKNTKKLPTTLDETVLSELPEQIRLEVLADYNLTSIENEDSAPESNLIEDSLNITLSQVDPSFLAALPEDVCSDLKNDLIHHKSNKQINLLQNKILKTKGKVLSKRNVNKKIMKAGNCSRKLDEYFSGKLNSSPEVLIKNEEVPVIEAKCAEVPKEKESGLFSSTMDINEIRDIVKEWVYTEDEPITIDIEIFTTFVCNLCLEKKLLMANQIIKCFHRCVERKKSYNWKTGYVMFLREVEKTITEKFKIKPKLPRHFSFENDK